jgi:cytochrome c-type biogenesis protein CcmE
LVPSNFVTRSERCPDCLRETIVVTVEQLLTQHGEVIASTVIAKARCTTEGCIGSKTTRGD